MKLKEIVMKIALISISVWVYVPIIAGLITLMIWVIPLAYTSWFLFQSFGPFRWIETIYSIGLPFEIFMFVFETIAFIGGLTLVFWGFSHIVKARKNNIKITQTGPYKYIRHPQNLGIILISFPFALMIPGYDHGIRVGDVLSWVFFCFLLIIWSDVEERKLQKEHPEEFVEYKSKTGYFFPRIREKQPLIIQKKKYYYFIRYLSFIFTYCMIVLIALLFTKYVPGSHVR